MIKRLSIALLLLTLVTTHAEHASALELHSALAIAYEKNPTLKAEFKRLEATFENITQAYANWLPSITASYEATRQRGRSNNDTRDEYATPRDRNLNINQPVFNGGGNFALLDQAESQVKAAQETLRQAEQQVMLEAVAAYIDVVRSREVLELSINNERVLGEQLEATVARFELGETTKTDVAQSRSRLATAKSDRINAEGQVTAAESEFKRVFVVAPPLNMQLPPSLPNVPDSLDLVIEAALQNNPSLRAGKFNTDVADANVDVAFSEILPTVSLNGNMSRSEGGGVGRFANVETESVTLNVTVPIYQTGSQHSAIRQAKKNARTTKYQLKQQHNDIVDAAIDAWQRYTTTTASIDARKASVDAAELALEGVREEQKIGSRTILEVLDAEQELFRARVELVSAERDRVLALYNIHAAMGTLTARDLELQVDTYDPSTHFREVKYKFVGF